MTSLISLVLLISTIVSLSTEGKLLSGHVIRVVLWKSGVTREKGIGGQVENTSPHFEVLKWLSASLGFKYQVLKSADSLRNTSTTIGFSTYLLNGEVDMYVGGLTMTAPIHAQFDVLYPWASARYDVLIPAPKMTNNFGAPWQPFTIQVWIATGLCFLAITASLWLLSYCGRYSNKAHYFRVNQSIDYVSLVLLNQGGYCYPKQLSVRSVAAVWCLGVFFLANFYSSTLISYITAQVPSPLIESVYDLPKRPDVYVAVEEGQAPDGFISRAQSGILKYMNNTLNRKPSIRCARMEQCLDLVVAGSHVFIQDHNVMNAYINSYIIPKYGQCQVTRTKEVLMTDYGVMVLSKHSPYNGLLNQETIRLAQTGLVEKWIRDLAPNQKACGDQRNREKTRIGLGNLRSSFVILLVGLAISLVVFVIEILTRIRSRNRLVSIPFNKQQIKKFDKPQIKKFNKPQVKKFNKQEIKK